MVVLSYPELYSDERVVLQAQNVKVKSVSFEVVLTTRRLVLIDTKKNSIPPQEINLATLKDVESGENAIRDPTITISIITISGNTRQMVLTFSKTSGGERRRECDDWVRALRQNVTSTVYHPVTQAPPPRETEPASPVQPPQTHHPDAPPPASPPHRIDITNTPPPKKRIEIARPMKKITEAPPVMPVPVETSSLPTGSFCNRCGNRVPPDSAFCNRCGTPVVQDAESGAAVPGTDNLPQQPAPAVPQVQVAPNPLYPAVTDKKDRPIEDVIHSIEPLIEDSVPRTAPAPLVPAKQVYHALAADPAEPAVQSAPATAPDAPAETSTPLSDVQWPVLSKSGIPDPSAPVAAPAAAPPAPVSMPPGVPQRKIPVKLIAVLALVILAILAGAFVFMQQGEPKAPEVTPTPAITIATTVPETTPPAVTTTVRPAVTEQQATTPPSQIPSSGVWVQITSSGKFSGSVGTPGRLRDVAGSGEQLYQIPTTDGPVVVSVQKSDGSSTALSVDVYKDGTLMKHGTTTAPKGIVEYQATVRTTTAAATTAAP